MVSKADYNLKRIWAINVFGSFGFFVWGYVNSINNSVLPYLQDFVFTDKTASEISLIASIMIFGAAFGAFPSGFISNKLGRRRLLFFGDFILIIGTIFTTIESYPLVILGRFVQGIIIGMNSTIGPLYLIEMAPKEMRGAAGTFNFLIMNSAIVVAYSLGYMVPT